MNKDVKLKYQHKKLIVKIKQDIEKKAYEFIDYGNSREKSFGCGMIASLKIIENQVKLYNDLAKHIDKKYIIK